jgi:hypothetical protein
MLRIRLPMLGISSFIGLAALAAASVQAAPSPNGENWVQLEPSFELGAEGCGVGRHQALRRDWRGDANTGYIICKS